jgi:hypothetical protein
MAEPGGTGGIDDVVLDEDFVRGASIAELDAGKRAKARAKEQAKADKRERRLYRRHVRRRRIRRATQTLVLLAGVAGVGVMAGQSGMGPLSFLQDDKTVQSVAAAGEESTAETEAVAGPTTSTTVVLERRALEVGDCVLWDQTAGRFGTRNRIEVVDCDRPHLIEVTGSFEPPAGPYPSEADWAAMFDTGKCAEIGGDYVGGVLDPDGIYGPRGIIPLEDAWRLADRQVWCGLQRYPLEEQAHDDPMAELFAGAIDRNPGAQHRILPVGSCLGPDGDGLTYGTVPCDGPHNVEISGHVDLTGRTDHLPAPEEYQRLVGDACHRQSQGYAGRNLRDPVSSGWLHIEQGSWDAGRRTVLCTVAEYRNQDTLTITRRLGAPPA